MNLGSIYRDLEQTLQFNKSKSSRPLNAMNGNIDLGIIQNLKSLASDIKVNAFNRDCSTKPYS